MKPINIAGFTIIETMLFLGISGMLILGILVGTGSSINVQRYRDSVTSLQSLLQNQFSEVSNVRNDSLLNICNGVGDQPRGQSDCVILGKLITASDSKTILIKTIIGTIPSSPSDLDDVLSLRQYNIQTSPLAEETYAVEWGSSLATPSGATKKFSMLVLRSPSSGIIRTFTKDDEVVTSDDQVRQLLAEPLALKQEVKLCIDSNGLLTGNSMAIILKANSTSASGIETVGDGNGC